MRSTWESFRDKPVVLRQTRFLFNELMSKFGPLLHKWSCMGLDSCNVFVKGLNFSLTILVKRNDLVGLRLHVRFFHFSRLKLEISNWRFASMEEVDQIIIPILRQIGCNFPDDLVSISQFQSDHMVFSCSVLLRSIDQRFKLPKRLPDGKGARFRICTDMAVAIQVS